MCDEVREEEEGKEGRVMCGNCEATLGMAVRTEEV